jgi:hypothetical protein
VYRFPREGSELQKQMLAATPAVFIEGYRRALERAISDRSGSLVLFWGMSTGGALLYPLAQTYKPDGYLGWGTSSTGLAYVANRSRCGSGHEGNMVASCAKLAAVQKHRRLVDDVRSGCAGRARLTVMEF